MDQTEEITAEFKTEVVEQEAAALPEPEAPQDPKPVYDFKPWIPMLAGLITLGIMVTIAIKRWLP